ncbi:MAG: hypothetical protein JOZ13_10090 [Alphaproteobacteria bacterium]|nr:hypothetical protein [Alphaproteobacteria bacterium]
MSEHRPGDAILNRYMPDASEEAREAARDNLFRLVDLVIRVNERLSRQSPAAIRQNEAGAVDSESPITLI